MCKKLEEISCVDPTDLQAQYGFTSKEESSMCTLLEQMRIGCSSVDFSPLERKLKIRSNNHVIVLSYSVGDDLRILYSKSLAAKSVNYALAHELAHCCLHMSPSSKYHIEIMTSDDIYSTRYGKKSEIEKEHEADHFALHLLVPKAELQSAKSNTEKRKIARKYNVPVSVLLKKSTL